MRVNKITTIKIVRLPASICSNWSFALYTQFKIHFFKFINML